MRDAIRQQLRDHRAVIDEIETAHVASIVAIVAVLEKAFAAGNKVLVMGNGGSAADAQHFVAELIGRFKLERSALPAVALTTDSSILTAIGNDYGFDRIFDRQVEGLAVTGDVVIGISTSGNSPNVLSALEKARERQCVTIALLGKDGGTIKTVADIALVLSQGDTPRVQEGHITLIHMICDLLEKRLFAGKP